MQALYKIVGASGWNVLFDEEQAASTQANTPATVTANPEFQLDFQDLDFTQPGFGAVSQSITPEQNTIVTLSLTVAVSYGADGGISARQVAAKAVRTIRQALRGQGLHIQIKQDGETQYYPNGTLQRYSPVINGAYVAHKWTFRTQDITVNPPTN